jgi:diguanylate cyclase (GGDEF)-like protein/PAS domain S-box-containing protein
MMLNGEINASAKQFETTVSSPVLLSTEVSDMTRGATLPQGDTALNLLFAEGVGHVLNAHPVATLVVNEHAHVLFHNAAAQLLFAPKANSDESSVVVGESFVLQDCLRQESLELVCGIIQQSLQILSPVDVLVQIRAPLPNKHFRLKLAPLSGISGAGLFLLSLYPEVVVSPVLETDAGDALLNSATEYIFGTDLSGRINYINQSCLHLWNKTQSEVIHQRLDRFLPIKNAIEHESAEARVKTSGQPWALHETLALGNEIIELETHKFPIFNQQSELVGIGSFARDMTATNENLRQQKLSDAIFQNTREAIALTDASGRIIRANPGWERITGFSERAVLGKRLSVLGLKGESSAEYRAIWAAVHQNGHWSGELTTRRSDGVESVVWATINAMFRDNGELLGHLIVQTDISELRAAHERIRVMAYTDELTELPNRKALIYKLNTLISHAYSRKHAFAVLFLDLDHFKEINDTLGHQVGDTLLVALSKRLQTSLRQSDIVARFGGDEFIVCLPQTGLNDACIVAQHLLQQISQPILLNEQTNYYPHASIGIAMYPQDGATVHDLLKSADQAMYAAKHKGRNQVQIYSAELDISNKNRFTLRNELAGAIANHELRIYLQPIFKLETMQVVGAEALIRWQHPTMGLIPPGVFLPLAHISKMMNALDNWMLQNTLQYIAAWYQQGLWQDDWKISINQNTDGIKDASWLTSIQLHIHELNVPVSCVSIELTEQLWVEPSPVVLESLNTLKTMGLSLAIDDFGTGYSSLAYLSDLPVTTLKIDQHFVASLKSDDSDTTLIDAIISLGQKLNFELIAEGVETEYQRKALLARGCQVAQGYLLSRPVPIEEFALKFLNQPLVSELQA